MSAVRSRAPLAGRGLRPRDECACGARFNFFLFDGSDFVKAENDTLTPVQTAGAVCGAVSAVPKERRRQPWRVVFFTLPRLYSLWTPPHPAFGNGRSKSR